MNDETNTATSEDNEPKFAILRVYLKDVSFETPNSPAIFLQEWRPQVSVRMEIAKNHVEGDVHEVVLHVEVTAKQGDRTGFLVELQQAGVFALEHYEDSERERMLGAYCPNVLFPFAREVVADLVLKGGFPQLLLEPVNFRAMYEDKLAAEREQQSG